MRLHLLAPIVLLLGCAPLGSAVSTGTARFSDYPEDLYAAFRAACEGPAQVYSRPRRDTAECRELLPPEATAAIILRYDGTIEDLPQLVIRFTTTPENPGYLVQNEVFLNVPRHNAAALRVILPDPRIARTIDALYRHAGGVPVAAQPGD